MGIPQCETKEIISGGDFNLFLDAELDVKGGRPTLKKRSVAKLISVIEHFTLAGYLQRHLYYFFVSNSLQGYICETEIQEAFRLIILPLLFHSNRLTIY